MIFHETRRAMPALLAMLLAACAHKVVQQIEHDSSVGQRMLLPTDKAIASGAVSTYQMKPQERFRMPQAIEAESPSFPADFPMTTFAPTTVCARIAISAEGTVLHADALDDRDDCHAGVASENASLMQAVRTQLLQWKFTPAAICTWPITAQPPKANNDCTGAKRMQAIPVSLMYAFTFEIREGKATVKQKQ
jgi:hypothetical protein